MAADNQSTIHVNGLRYRATEESIREAFNPSGAIDSVKIVNGRRGKCYCFVSFRNPRSVRHAIIDMDGKTIDGRVVKVTAARNRPGERSSSGRDSSRRDDAGRGIRGGRYDDRSRKRDRSLDRYAGRGIQGGRHREQYNDRSRERDRSLDRDAGRGIQSGRYRGQYNDRSKERDRSLHRDVGKGIGYDQARDHDRERGGFADKEEEDCSDESIRENEQGRDGERERNLVCARDKEPQGTAVDQKIADEKDTDHSDLREIIENRVRNNDGTRKDFASELSADEVKEELERSVKRLEESRMEVSQLEEKLQDKTQLILDLQSKNKKLKDAFTDGKKLLSQNRAQLANLQNHFLQVKECQDQLTKTEQELESLFDPSILGSDSGGDDS